jgi:N-acetylmuramoyl-L-alanine amidase/FlgD Ig-like domain
VPSIIRSIYAYHIHSNGWCDIGYNYLVDKFGRIWEGRYGGITKPVIGAHTGGFNTNTFGVSLIGNFTSTTPSSAMLGAVEKLFAWRLGVYYRDPLGKATTTAGYFSGSRYAAGSTVTFNVISGHRNADLTSCPGDAAYTKLPTIRNAVKTLMGTGFVSPRASPTTVRMASGAVKLASNVVSAMSWTTTVTDANNNVVKTLTGTASRSAPVSASWDLTDLDGHAVLPGVYTLRMTGANSGGATAVPFTTHITVTPPVSISVPSQVGLGANVGAKGTGRPNGTVDVKVTSGGVVTDLGIHTVSSSGTWSATSSPATATHDLTWSVTDAATGFVATRRTRVGPTITAPSTTPTFINAGTALAVHGTALPDNGNTVALVTQPVGTTTTTRGPSLAVSTNTSTLGAWQTALTPSVPTTFWAQDSRNLVSAKRLVYPVKQATASAPTSGYAGRSVTVRGNAGNAPVQVTLSARQGSASWTVVRQTTAATTGAFAARLPLPTTGTTLSWRVTTGYGSAVTGSVSVLPTFPPTATGPARVTWNSTHAISGNAVPGDVVTVWTRPAGSTAAWVQAGSTKAASTKAWTFPLTVTGDIDWRVSSPSGTTSVLTTVVAPSIQAPSTSTAKALIVVHGTGIPGTGLTLWRQLPGTTTWTSVGITKIGADGRWQVTRQPWSTTRFKATSHHQASRVVTVTIG